MIVSVRPSIFLCAKNAQNLGETGPSVPVFISKASDQLLPPAERAVTVGWHRPIEYRYGDGGVCACVCVRACVRDVFAIYDNNIWPRLIMIIIKNIILYFIQIRWFPLIGYPASVTLLLHANLKYHKGNLHLQASALLLSTPRHSCNRISINTILSLSESNKHSWACTIMTLGTRLLWSLHSAAPRTSSSYCDSRRNTFPLPYRT